MSSCGGRSRRPPAPSPALPEREDPLRVGLKIPFGYLAIGSLVSDVEQALERSGLAPERLVLQMSAPAVTSEDERIRLDVASLRLMGVHVALDGFGSGSCVAHLTRRRSTSSDSIAR